MKRLSSLGMILVLARRLLRILEDLLAVQIYPCLLVTSPEEKVFELLACVRICLGQSNAVPACADVHSPPYSVAPLPQWKSWISTEPHSNAVSAMDHTDPDSSHGN